MEPKAERAICPGCGAPLPLVDMQTIVTCIYCGCDSKVIRHLRKIEPDLPVAPHPTKAGDPAVDYDRWSAEQLIHGLLNEKDRDKRLAMAKALDCWSHVNEITAAWIPTIIEIMQKSDRELDIAISGILGKFICSDDLKLKQMVIAAGEKYAFNVEGSFGLLFALSLGDAGTVKLLLDVAEWAAQEGANDYACEALIGVQTAIGRENERRQVCMEILVYRFLYVSSFVQDWIARFLRNHFDVGYTFMHGFVLELIDDCAYEAPDLLPKLQNALKYCRPAKSREEFLERLSVLGFLRSIPSKISACESLGEPPPDITMEDVNLAVKTLTPFFMDSVISSDQEYSMSFPQSKQGNLMQSKLAEAAAEAFSKFVWIGQGIPEPILNIYKNYRDLLPQNIIQSIELRMR